MEDSTVQVQTNDGTMDLFVATPDAAAPLPAIVVCQEAFGVNDHIKAVTRKLADAGYLACAPDLFHRFDRRIVGYDDIATAKELLGQVTNVGAAAAAQSARGGQS